jgi:hypothetical protein
MTTANEDVWTTTAQTTRAGVLTRGSGLIDLTKAHSPGITLDKPSLSGGEMAPGQSAHFTITATDVAGAASSWTVTSVETAGGANFDITPGSASLSVPANGAAQLAVHVSATASAASGNYEGKVELTSGGKTLHVPVWLRVINQAPVADVLLVDDDGSSADPKFADYSQVYKDLLGAAGVSYEYLDVWNSGFKPYFQLYGYKVVLIFTGDNDSFDTSGFSPTDHDALAEWMDSGGKLWTTGQNMAEVTDSNLSFSSESLGRSRLYHGYLGLKFVAGDTYGDETANRPTANGKGPLKKLRIDLSPGGDGAGNQGSIEASEAMHDPDTYAAEHTMIPLFVSKHDEVRGRTAIGWARVSEAGLKEKERQEYRYRSVAFGFGLEGVNSNTGFTTRQQLFNETWKWLSDNITFTPITTAVKKPGKDNIVLTTSATSSTGAKITGYEWDFGDGDGVKRSKTGTVDHKYRDPGDYVVRVAATDDLGHTQIHTQTIHVAG